MSDMSDMFFLKTPLGNPPSPPIGMILQVENPDFSGASPLA